MKGKEKPYTSKHEITNDGNYDARCELTPVPVSDLENVNLLGSVAECTHI